VNGLICVISNDEEVFTYEIMGGKPYLVGEGDLHDPAYSSEGHSVILNDIETAVTSSKTYKLTVYPSDLLHEAFLTNSPILIGFAFVGIILLCTAIFFLYDFFMREQSRRSSAILEIKRKFVR